MIYKKELNVLIIFNYFIYSINYNRIIYIKLLINSFNYFKKQLNKIFNQYNL